MGFLRRFTYGLSLGGLFFVVAWWVGWLEGRHLATWSLIGTAIVLEAQPAAAESVAFRMHPLPGAIISILGNCIFIPALALMLREIIERWAWFHRKLKKAEVWSNKYGKYGVWILVPLSPVLGAYVCIGLGYLMRWNARLVMVSVWVGMVVSTFVITYGGETVVRALRPYL